MLEVVVFALVLVLAQLAVSLGLMALMFSNWFTKKLMKKSLEISMGVMEVVEEMEEKL